jgi:hypothetical protein
LAQIPSFGSLYRPSPGLSKSVHFSADNPQHSLSDKVQLSNDSIHVRPKPGSIGHFKQVLIAQREQLKKNGLQQAISSTATSLYTQMKNRDYRSSFTLEQALKVAEEIESVK